MEEFSTWRDFKKRLLDDLIDPSFRRMTQYSINAAGTGGSRTVTYRSLGELKALIDWADLMIAKEEGPDYAGRTYAANGGRG
jgi:hypothetical protein